MTNEVNTDTKAVAVEDDDIDVAIGGGTALTIEADDGATEDGPNKCHNRIHKKTVAYIMS